MPSVLRIAYRLPRKRVGELEGIAMGRPLIGTIMMIVAVVFLPVFFFSAMMGNGTEVWLWMAIALVVFLVGLYLRKHPQG